jgi:sarcosine oxidase subunit alpha
MQRNRLAEGGRIDRSRPLTFLFNGRSYKGFAGDTLASALLANEVRVVGRSFKYHRARGIVAAGMEEPNALVQLGPKVGGGGFEEANARATQVELFDGLDADSVNCWPSPDLDFGAVAGFFSRLLPAGFYYKTFMWPPKLWMTYEHFIRRAAGLGKASKAPDADAYDKRWAHCDVLVAGGGPAGLAAALAAGRGGARVILADEQAEFGGALLDGHDEIDGRPALDWVVDALAELRAMPDVRLIPRGTIASYYDHNFLAVYERLTDHLGPQADAGPGNPRGRLWKIRARQVVLATGSHERPLVFADNDRPGVMLAGAVRAYLNRYGARPGQTGVVFTNNDSAYSTALDMAAAGIAVPTIVDLRPDPDGDAVREARELGIEILANHAVIAVSGAKGLRSIEVAPIDASAKGLAGEVRRIACDHLAVSGGWNPAVHLFSQSRGKLDFNADLNCFVPGESFQPERSAGACNGAFGLAACLAQGHAAGAAAAEAAGHAGKTGEAPRAADRAVGPIRHMPIVPGKHPVGRGKSKHFVDVQNDVTAADIALAVREGYRSVEHAKRYTTLGMGPDQGKMGGMAGFAVLADSLGKAMPEVGTTTFRPPYTPVPFGAVAGRDVGALADPARTTPMHSWHVSAGAVFDSAGQWLLPDHHPKEGEDRAAAVRRECLAVRQGVGIRDGSTLGKVDIRGPDSARMLDWIYTNAWASLGIGRCRYGVMLGEDGMVMDDGVTARLGEDHYLMHTTTGNASGAFWWLEEWLQNEWLDYKVWVTSVTEQWAVVNIAGPRARDLLAELCRDIDLSNDAFPHMSVRTGRVSEIPARVFRVSFTGELSYEINVAAGFGLALWNAVMLAGQRYGITPFGAEAVHVLRAEKGYLAAGQEIDGTVTPQDLGLDWAISKKKADFLGKRSLTRSAMVLDDRKQLVGLLTKDPAVVLPEGAQIVGELRATPPMPMIGHVTSSYHSPSLGRSIALALIQGGRARIGETVSLPLRDRTVEAEVTKPIFYDPEGGRHHA